MSWFYFATGVAWAGTAGLVAWVLHHRRTRRPVPPPTRPTGNNWDRYAATRYRRELSATRLAKARAETHWVEYRAGLTRLPVGRESVLAESFARWDADLSKFPIDHPAVSDDDD